MTEFVYSDLHVLRQDKTEKDLLLGVEVGIDMHPRMVSAFRRIRSLCQAALPE